MFKTTEILPFSSHYMFYLLYVLNKKHLFMTKVEVHNKNIRSANIFQLHFTNLNKYQKWTR